jgi:tripartite-type tricarboxylate transporter receptor subunit TctC
MVVGFSAGGTTDFMARLANEDLNSHAEFHLRSPADPIS